MKHAYTQKGHILSNTEEDMLNLLFGTLHLIIFFVLCMIFIVYFF